jgi:hypothetical protein
MQKIISLSILLLMSSFSYTQFFNSKPDSLYYDHKSELFIGGGLAWFSRDLSGLNLETNNDYGPLSRPNTILNLGLRRHLKPKFATITQLNWYWKRYRSEVALFSYNYNDFISSYSFARADVLKINLIDVSQRFEFVFFSKYNTFIKDEVLKNNRFELSIFSGLGLVYFDSKTNSNSEYINRGFGNKFTNLSLFIPSGLGLQKSISKSLSLRFELTYSLPLSDYNFKIKQENCAYLNSINYTSDFDFCNLEFEKHLDYYLSANFSLVKLLKSKDKKFIGK